MSIPTEVGEDGEISLFEDEKTLAFLAGVLVVEEVNQRGIVVVSEWKTSKRPGKN